MQGQPLFQESKDIKRGSISVSPSGKEGELFQSDVKKQTGTPEFKKWFGDSKVVDEDGNPLLMYHGTAREFTEFDPSLSGSTYGTEQSGIFLLMTEKMRLQLQGTPPNLLKVLRVSWRCI